MPSQNWRSIYLYPMSEMGISWYINRNMDIASAVITVHVQHITTTQGSTLYGKHITYIRIGTNTRWMIHSDNNTKYHRSQLIQATLKPCNTNKRARSRQLQCHRWPGLGSTRNGYHQAKVAQPEPGSNKTQTKQHQGKTFQCDTAPCPGQTVSDITRVKQYHDKDDHG